MTFWLRVPYAEKDLAKDLGCRWDQDYKKWWKPQSIDESVIPRHWIIQHLLIKDKDGKTKQKGFNRS